MAQLRTLNYNNGYTLYKNSNFRPRMKCCFEVKDCCNSYTNLSCWSKRADSYSQLCCFDRTIGLFINDVTHLGGGGFADWWCYSISLFCKMGDKGEGGVKNLKKWVTSCMDGPCRQNLWVITLILRCMILLWKIDVSVFTEHIVLKMFVSMH